MGYPIPTQCQCSHCKPAVWAPIPQRLSDEDVDRIATRVIEKLFPKRVDPWPQPTYQPFVPDWPPGTVTG